MDSLRHLLPSPTALIVFEAAGRLGSFTNAGQELGMSQAAVSHAVRGLETHLGVALFRRAHRRVELTDTGARFFADVTQGLSVIGASARKLRAKAHGGHVSLAASTAFAAYWMMPRLAQLRAALPGVELRLHTSERDLDLIAEGVALGVRGGDPADWPGYDALPLATEAIIAVAAPGYLHERAAPMVPAELGAHRLIHLDEPFRAAPDWADWFASAGVARTAVPRGLVINDYVLVLQAVIDGQGIALGWQHLIAPLLRSGQLVQITDHCLNTGRVFHVIWPRNPAPGPHVRAVRDWLVSQGNAR